MREILKRIRDFAGERKNLLTGALVLSFIRCSFGVTQLFAVLTAIRVILGETDARSGIITVLVLTAVCVVGNYGASYWEQILSMQAGYFTTADKRVAIGSHLRLVPLGFFNETSGGRITATLTGTLAGVEMAAPMTMVGIVAGLFNGLVMLIFMLVYDWRIGLLTAVGMVLYLQMVAYQMRLSRKAAPDRQKAQTDLAEAAISFLRGIRVTRAFSLKEGDVRLKEAVEGSMRENIRLTARSMPSQVGAGMILAVFEALILIAAVFLHFHAGLISPVHAVMLILFSFMVYAPLNQAGSMLSMIGMIETGMDEAKEIEDTEEMKCREPEEVPESDEITFSHVSFSYGDHTVLSDVNTVIEPGTLTAIVGPSGSGKTTLCQLILRFRDVDSGSIRIGGADVRNMETEELMKRISTVFQRVYLFEDTIFNNIRFGKPDATKEEVLAAARAARCDEFIRKLPKGYDTMVEEGGNSLSGGERQRISIARAILKDAPVILLDEATSALDAENERDILAAIDELTRNKTVIMIAHRLPTVKRADRILVLDQGRIVQEGTHEELKNQKGLYADFLASREKAAGWTLSV